MNFEKMFCFTNENLKKLIDISQEIGRKSNENKTEDILQKIAEIESLKLDDFIKVINKNTNSVLSII